MNQKLADAKVDAFYNDKVCKDPVVKRYQKQIEYDEYRGAKGKLNKTLKSLAKEDSDKAYASHDTKPKKPENWQVFLIKEDC